jgi:hypothetical protein
MQASRDSRSEEVEQPKVGRVASLPVNGFPEMRIYYLVSEKVLRIV